ncbi:unnamed protein product [Rotaria sp. Silwood2]|nr:unnamed protein product [Rotaria sp. Silwood2]CAF4167455.1 unnamed protein product [Rotaria sp. Silwood2]CAF4421151.1 unnamed protein product [Rotaria sp. Silwood2]
MKKTQNKNTNTHQLCPKLADKVILRRRNNWSTSSVRHHLIKVHKKTELILENGRQKQNLPNIKQERKEQLHKLCIEAIVQDNLPFNAFNETDLSKLLKEVVPGYQPIRRNTVARRIKRLKHHHHSKLIEYLRTVETMSITTDFWSNRTNTSFLVLTVHYCTNDLN